MRLTSPHGRLEILTNQLAVYRLKYAPRVAIVLGAFFAGSTILFQALRVFAGISSLQFAVTAFGTAALLAATVVSFTLAILVRNKFKLTKSVEVFGDESTRRYMQKVRHFNSLILHKVLIAFLRFQGYSSLHLFQYSRRFVYSL